MWLRMAIGAWAGILVGHYTRPGYAFWMVVGVLIACCLQVWESRRQAASDAGESVDS